MGILACSTTGLFNHWLFSLPGLVNDYWLWADHLSPHSSDIHSFFVHWQNDGSWWGLAFEVQLIVFSAAASSCNLSNNSSYASAGVFLSIKLARSWVGTEGKNCCMGHSFAQGFVAALCQWAVVPIDCLIKHILFNWDPLFFSCVSQKRFSDFITSWCIVNCLIQLNMLIRQNQSRLLVQMNWRKH